MTSIRSLRQEPSQFFQGISFLKELRNCILRIIPMWPLFPLIWAYVGLEEKVFSEILPNPQENTRA